jgi:hypothetical protein
LTYHNQAAGATDERSDESQPISIQSAQYSISNPAPIQSHKTNLVHSYVANLPAMMGLAELENDVRKFARENGLEYISDLLLRGARVARDPILMLVQDLKEEERDALTREPNSGFWQQTKLKVIVLTCSIAAIIQCVIPVPHIVAIGSADLQYP